MSVRIATIVLGFALAHGASADIVAIGPFSGDLHEPLNQSGTTIAAQVPIFGGAAVLRSFDGVTTAIHLLASDSFNGDLVTPHTGGRILGFTTGPAHFVFNSPVRRFGAYFNNDSGADDATIEFFDNSNASLGIRIATTPAPGNVWVWNGWQSDTPVSRITVTGNGVLHGFLWFDDLELAYVPAPWGAFPLGIGTFVLSRRRRDCAL